MVLVLIYPVLCFAQTCVVTLQVSGHVTELQLLMTDMKPGCVEYHAIVPWKMQEKHVELQEQ